MKRNPLSLNNQILKSQVYYTMDNYSQIIYHNTAQGALTSMYKCEHILCCECVYEMWKVNNEHIICPQCRKPVRYQEEMKRLIDVLRADSIGKKDTSA